MKGPTDEARAEAKRRYEAGGESGAIRAIARDLKIDPKTLRSMRDRERWIPPPDSPGGTLSNPEEIRKNVIDITTKKAVQLAEESGAIDRIAEAVTLDLGRDVLMTAKLGDSVDKTIDRFLRGEIRPSKMQNEADVLKSIIGAAKDYTMLRRTVAGKSLGEANVDLGPKVDPNITLKVQRLPAKKENVA